MTGNIYLQNFDYVAILIYIALMAVIGFTFGWLVKDSNSFFKGGGTIPWVMATITNYMGLFSTFVFVAYAGIAYKEGIISMVVFLTTVPGCVVAGLIFGARWRRTGDTTPVEYLEKRYGYPMRKLVMWLGLVMRFLDNMVRLYAIGIFIAAVTPISFGWAIVISGVIVTLFNIIGGIWTVTIMSTVQFIILILVTAILLPLSLDASGGLSALAAKFPEHLEPFNGPKGSWLWLTVYCLMVTLKYNENWTFIQKFYCVRDESAARKVGIYSGILFLLFTPVFLIPAVISPLIVPNIADPEMSYVMISSMLLPVGVMGIMFSSMFAATMSSLNAEYNIMAGVMTTDIYQRMINPNADGKKLLNVARISTIIVGVIMILGAFGVKNFGGAFEANKLFTGILAIPIGIPLVLGIVSRAPTQNSSVATIVVGVVLGIVINMIPQISWELGTLIEMAVCLAIYYLPVLNKNRVYSESEKLIFQKIETPIPENEKPDISPEYIRSLVYLFVFSMVVAGLLFGGMSLPTVNTTGGLYGVIAGGLCVLSAGGIYLVYSQSKAKKALSKK
ncbi:MAG: sodium transporter [Opitutales bacterium]|nr:sodium transporter [Opitutales bacterium]